jgi:hypothetical protein
VNFLDELIEEAELKETQQVYAYNDLLILEISKLESEIESNFQIAAQEKEFINKWALEQNAKLKDKADLLKAKLEKFIREEGLKTIDLPHGIVKLHKKPDKIEITDVELFLKEARPEMVSIVPESVKPDLNKIKSWIKMTTIVPKGVSLIEGKEEFSLKIKSFS